MTNPDKAVFNFSAYGPVFGNLDICCWDYDGKSYIWFPNSYEDTIGRGVQTFTGGEIVHGVNPYVNFTIDRLEVWSVFN